MRTLTVVAALLLASCCHSSPSAAGDDPPSWRVVDSKQASAAQLSTSSDGAADAGPARTTGAESAPDAGAARALPGRGEPCPQGACAEGLQCLSYFGVAGPRGPRFSSCERPCGLGCPEGEICVTVADGPGRVCQARDPRR